MMANLRPPIVSVADRPAFDVLAATEYWTVPSPFTDPSVMVIQLTSLTADQEHPPLAETAVAPPPPSHPIVAVFGETVIVHPLPPPPVVPPTSCVIVYNAVPGQPPTAIVPVRELGVVFGD